MRPGWTGNLPFRSDDPALGARGLDLGSLERFRATEAVAEALDLVGSDDAPLVAPSTGADLRSEVMRLLPAGCQSIGFRISGSTGRAKKGRYRLVDLHREVEELARLVGPVTRGVSLVPAQTIYGFLITILLPRRVGAR